MNRCTWARIAIALIALLLLPSLASCSDEPSAQNKRLTDQGPCDLVDHKELEKIFGVIEVYPPRRGVPSECGYNFHDGDVYVRLANDSGQRDPLTEIDGVTVKEHNSNLSCVIDVWLKPDDIRQEFSVSVYLHNGDAHCDAARAAVRAVLNSLPG